jgi:hypothetical protein
MPIGTSDSIPLSKRTRRRPPSALIWWRGAVVVMLRAAGLEVVPGSCFLGAPLLFSVKL